MTYFKFLKSGRQSAIRVLILFLIISVLSVRCMSIHGSVNKIWKEEIIMSKGNGGRGSSTHSGPGGNWPSTTGKPSGGGRGNAK